jgi:hypothetical protein
MNPLESLINKLEIKPQDIGYKPVDVLIKGTYKDEKENEFDIDEIMKTFTENKMLKVILKQQILQHAEIIEVPENELAIKKAVKVGEKRKIIIEEDETEGTVAVTLPKKTERKTKPVEKGIAVLGPETFVEIGDIAIDKRLPIKEKPFKIIASSYYMNNREKFVNFINSLFAPYKEELKQNAANISCETIGNTSSNMALLLHQQIVRDYMNLYTPYRGLLLYHGLGSGKTCSSIAIAEGMKDSKRVIIMTPKSLRRNYMEELKKCGDLMYKKDQYWEFISTIKDENLAKVLSAILNLPIEYIKKKKGAWFVNITKPSNYIQLSTNSKISLDDQLDTMIEAKYLFINYNGLRLKRLEELTSGFTRNLFDNSVVVIDEAHNLVSRIVNKIKKEPLINEIKKGDQERAAFDLAKKLSDIVDSSTDITEITEKKKTALKEHLSNLLENIKTNQEINDNEKNTLEKSLINILKGVDNLEDASSSIQQAHDLIAIIITRLKENPVLISRVGEKEFLPKYLSSKLYEYLLSAKNARIILLTGTPVINYPNEFGIIFNILRGYIKTWEFPIDDSSTKTIDKDILMDILKGEKSLDYVDYSQSSHILSITRNPFGFKNKIKKEEGYKGVTNAKETSKGILDIDTSSFDNDTDFEKRIIGILKRNDINILSAGIKITNKKALPDTLDLFIGQYIDDNTKKLKNIPALNRRIIGLSSYFRSAQESLLPRFTKTLGVDYHIVRIPMSDFQFKIYEASRVQERKTEKFSKGPQTTGGLFKESTSTYRIFSRLFCNYVMPDRPIPNKESTKSAETAEEIEDVNLIGNILKEADKIANRNDLNDDNEGEVEGDEILNNIGGLTYKNRIDAAIKHIEENSNDFLTPEALEKYSPKFLHMFENINDPRNIGLHLVYSQFRTLEGVGIFSLVLEKNGFARFKIIKSASNSWEIDISESDAGKPTYALYTGTESPEEKEIIRNIYNGDWDFIPTNIANELRQKSNNNNIGDIIKVLMITSSGSEGINLRNTRFVHIMEPYWHPVRIEQVIGRARRICSHKNLPIALQTVEVFIYLMILSESKLESGDANELRKHDLSKIDKVPVTTDQLLYEISEIKGNLTRQLTESIKESSFDCQLYSNGKCVNFGEPNSDKFAYFPDYSKEVDDNSYKLNQTKKITWKGKPITISDVEYIYKRINENLLNIYDKSSYMAALTNPNVEPLLIGTLETIEGKRVFKPI